jgi:DNA-binding transcriptional LysR family regulator
MAITAGADWGGQPQVCELPKQKCIIEQRSDTHNQSMFDWNDLKYFLAVARHGSTLSAAKALGLSQSTVHRRLDELQKRLGQRLVTRRPNGYRLTELGEQMRRHAESVENAAAAFERRLAASKSELTGVIRVTCPEVLGFRLMHSSLIKKFNARYPALRVEVIVSDKYLDLAKGEADIAIRACAPAPTDPTLFGRKIAPSPWAVYASKAYLARHGGIERIEDINAHAVIRFEATMRDHPAARWLQSVAPDASVTARGSGVPAALTAVKSGSGLGVLPLSLGDNESDLVRLFGPIPNLPSDIYLLIHEDMKATPRIRAFFDFIISEIVSVRKILDTRGAAKNKRPPRKGRPLKHKSGRAGA